MTLYPIGAVAKLTGLSIEALRAWERRYGAVRPVRDERGRMYTEADVRRLQLLQELTTRGHHIGQIAARPTPELERLKVPPNRYEPPDPPTPALDVDAFLAQVRAFQTGLAERRLVELALMLSPRDLVYRVALPLLRRVGEEWCRGRLGIAEEHAVSSLLQSLLGSVVRQQADPAAPVRLVFAQGPDERHGLGLWCAAVLAAAARFGVVYLGADLPIADIAAAAVAAGAAAVVLGPAHDISARAAARDVRALAEALPDTVDLWLGGPDRQHLDRAELPGRVIGVPDLEAFERELGRRKALEGLF